MIELDENDIKAVASSRFFRKTWKKALAVVLLFFGVVILAGVLGLPILGYTVMGLFLVAYILFFRMQVKAEKTLVQEWRQGQQETA